MELCALKVEKKKIKTIVLVGRKKWGTGGIIKERGSAEEYLCTSPGS